MTSLLQVDAPDFGNSFDMFQGSGTSSFATEGVGPGFLDDIMQPFMGPPFGPVYPGTAPGVNVVGVDAQGGIGEVCAGH